MRGLDKMIDPCRSLGGKVASYKIHALPWTLQLGHAALRRKYGRKEARRVPISHPSGPDPCFRRYLLIRGAYSYQLFDLPHFQNNYNPTKTYLVVVDSQPFFSCFDSFEALIFKNTFAYFEPKRQVVVIEG